jgi:hypothetical protein
MKRLSSVFDLLSLALKLLISYSEKYFINFLYARL